MPQYNETRVNLTQIEVDEQKQPKTDEKGEIVVDVITNVVEKKYNELAADAKAKGVPEPEVTKIQTFQYTEVADPAELLPLLEQYNGGDSEAAKKVAIDIINRGLVLREQRVVREFMLDEDQAAVEGTYDLMTDAAKVGEGRRKADPASKAAKALSDMLGRTISPADVAAMLAAFQAPEA